MVPQGAVDVYSVAARLLQGKLQGAEEAGGAWDSDRDEPEFPQDLLPPLVADAAEARELGEDPSELQLAMSRELDGLAQGVQDPAKDQLAGGLAAIAGEELLERDRLSAVWLVQAGLGKDLVDGVEEVSAKVAHAAWPSLAQEDEVVNEDIRGSQGPGEGPVARRGDLLARSGRATLGCCVRQGGVRQFPAACQVPGRGLLIPFKTRRPGDFSRRAAHGQDRKSVV